MAQEPPHAVCPVPGESCKILLLSPTEEKMLMITNGILDTAAQARALDLGQISVYLKTRIASAPAGEIKPAVPGNQGNPALGAGPANPAANRVQDVPAKP
jgi:hypothetical protein